MNSPLRIAAIIFTLSLMFISLSISWQPATQAQTQSSTSRPSDGTAYQDAIRITDPKQKVEALEKFIADYPRSQVLYRAHQATMRALIKISPEQTGRILTHAQQTIETAPEPIKITSCNEVATDLIEAGLLLDKAKEFANQALALASARFGQSQSMRPATATRDALIGRIYLKQGKTKDAEKAFLSAYNASPPAEILGSLPGSAFKQVACSLAELAEKSGKSDKVLDYLTTALLFGKIDEASKQRLETAYRRTHQNSLDGLEELVDAKYEKEFPLPVKAKPYQPASERSDRTVLAEVFTGSGCPPCVAMDLAYEAFLERYQRQDVIVLMYHQHIPLPDPMSNPFSQARAKYYGVRGVPTFAIDGKANPPGGGARAATQQWYDRIRPLIEKQLEVKAEAEIKLEAVMANSAIQVSAQVKPTVTDASNLKLQIALVEERLRFSGENRVRFHPMVVRSLAGEHGSGFVLAEKTEGMTWRFDLTIITQELKKHLDDLEQSRKDRGEESTFAEKKHAIDPSKLLVVAFVQDEKSKQVLQAVSVKVNPAPTSR